MTRPFMLYHWSPSKNRASIKKYGLVPGKKSVCGQWNPSYICFSRYPTVSWALSATHQKPQSWDLWCCWSNVAVPLDHTHKGKENWWMAEYRTPNRIPKSKLWFVGTREFKSHRHD